MSIISKEHKDLKRYINSSRKSPSKAWAFHCTRLRSFSTSAFSLAFVKKMPKLKADIDEIKHWFGITASANLITYKNVIHKSSYYWRKR